MADLTGMLQAAAGAAGAAEGAYIEDVFSTYLYTGNGSTQTITNGIDLAGEGGLVWIKSRSAATNHQLFDTNRGATKELISNTPDSEATDADTLTSFNSNGFALGADATTNTSSATYASWSFRKAPKFFDVVTWTGDGTNPRQIAHNLGSVPGCIIVKRTNGYAAWFVYHRANTVEPETDYLMLDSTSATNDGDLWADTLPTDTVFTVSANTNVNASGGTYVAYLFAHDAGGFGDDGEQNVISCGSFTTDGSGNASVTLGYEPQWLLVKRTDSTDNWRMIDNMRGFTSPPNTAYIYGNLSNAEQLLGSGFAPTATGFTTGPFTANGTYIYIAIRRGPMKTPTSGTEVFTPITKTADAPTATLSEIGFQFDTVFNDPVSGPFGADATYANKLSSRLTGLGSSSQALTTSSTAAETTYAYTNWDGQTFSVGNGWGASSKWAWHFFRRAPGFFDVVCFTAPSSGSWTVPHNLGVQPELVISKRRDSSSIWPVTADALGNDGTYLQLDSTAAQTFYAGYQVASSTEISYSSGSWPSAALVVLYMFATLPGVSKVGSYTGTGTTLQVNCGFSAGARLVLIKRTDSTGDWYVWDSARGISASSDPYILLNSTAAEVTGTDYIDPLASGFEISSTAPAAINASGGNFIFLAIA